MVKVDNAASNMISKKPKLLIEEGSHGSPVRRLNPLQDCPYQLKEFLHHGAKVRIAQAAARLIRSDQKIFLDSGTITAEVAQQIKHF